MRTDFDSVTAAAIRETTTRPVLLVSLMFPGELYLSTNGDHRVGGIDYIAEGVNVRALADWSQASVRIPATPERSAIVDTPDWRNLRCKISMVALMEYPRLWQAGYDQEGYGIQGTLYGKPYTLLDGLLTGAALDGEWIALQVSHIALQLRWSPRIRVAPPVFNHLPAPGSVVRWGDTLYTFEARLES